MIDVNKPVECRYRSEDGWRPARIVGEVKYKNPSFTHAVAISFGDYEEVVPMDFAAEV